MAIPTRLIRRRVKSVASTRKIMKAMELVAAAKMRRTTDQALRARPYAFELARLTSQVRQSVSEEKYPLLVGTPRDRDDQMRTLVVVVASDRGLCGGFNAQVLRSGLAFLRSRPADTLRVMTVGRRAEQGIRRAGFDLMAAFDAISNAPSFERSHPMAQMVTREFLEGRADRVFVAYAEFVSALRQTPVVRQLLPIIPESAFAGPDAVRRDVPWSQSDQRAAEMFEPSPEAVMESLLPRLVEMQVYQALLEASASEQSARMMAMKNAHESAGEVLDDLVFTLNQTRQALITREISEISAGKAAVE